jgi:hypothetical protein
MIGRISARKRVIMRLVGGRVAQPTPVTTEPVPPAFERPSIHKRHVLCTSRLAPGRDTGRNGGQLGASSPNIAMRLVSANAVPTSWYTGRVAAAPVAREPSDRRSVSVREIVTPAE